MASDGQIGGLAREKESRDRILTHRMGNLLMVEAKERIA